MHQCTLCWSLYLTSIWSMKNMRSIQIYAWKQIQRYFHQVEENIIYIFFVWFIEAFIVKHHEIYIRTILFEIFMWRHLSQQLIKFCTNVKDKFMYISFMSSRDCYWKETRFCKQLSYITTFHCITRISLHPSTLLLWTKRFGCKKS